MNCLCSHIQNTAVGAISLTVTAKIGFGMLLKQSRNVRGGPSQWEGSRKMQLEHTYEGLFRLSEPLLNNIRSNANLYVLNGKLWWRVFAK
jgi:hypothetical protein